MLTCYQLQDSPKVDEADIYQFHSVDEADMTVFISFALLLRLIATSFM